MQVLAWFDDAFSWRLTQALLHFLWQGSLLGLLVPCVDRILGRAASSLRYAVHASALLAMAACLPVTYALLDAPRPPAGPYRTASTAGSARPTVGPSSLDASAGDFSQWPVLGRSAERPRGVATRVGEQTSKPNAGSPAVAANQALATSSDVGSQTAAVSPARPAAAMAWLVSYSPFISAGYAIGVLLMTLRLAVAWWGVQRLRHTSLPVEDPQLLATIAGLARRLGLRAAPVMAYCREITVPIIVGVLKPLILLPASMAGGLPCDQVQALVAHELAHLRRFDPLVNVLQRLVEAVLFFHPAVWYVSRRISVEREHASDDLVLTLGIPRLAYADALVRMAEVSLALRQPRLAGATLAASGNSSSEFKRRVLRLLGDAPTVRTSPWGALCVLIFVATGLAVPVLVQAWPAPEVGAEPASAFGSAERLGRQIDNFALHDYLGTEHELHDFSGSRLVVVAFLATECPLAKRYGPRLSQLAAAYRDRGVAFVGINSNCQDTPSEMGRYVREHGIAFPLLKDPENRVADRFGAIRTPEVFVLDEQRVVRYWGGIDDQFGIGFVRPKATEQFLVAALDELLADTPVRRPESPAVGCHIGRVTRQAPTGDVTYAQQISRIVQRRCVECHRDGGIAPFALGSYADVAGWAETIREVITDERMPPWHADPKYGHFSNDGRMPESERRLLCQWIDNGVPEGPPADLPPPATFVDGWSLGQPDLVVSMPEPFSVAADGVVPYQYITVDPGFTEGKWVRASEVRPGMRSVVHHVIVFVDPPGGDPILEERGVGFETVGGYVPGAPPMQLDEGVARYVPPGSTLVFQVHYTPDGQVQRDRTRIGLYFADPSTVRYTMQTVVAANLDFEIPPHADAHQVEAGVRLSNDTQIYALMPHMHFRGKSFRFTANYPNGTREILLDVPRYDFNWQHTYRLAQPKLLPEGTLLKCVACFDNSPDNPANPDPASPVKWGEQSWEEMMVGYADAVFLNQDLTLPEPTIAPLGNDTYRVHFAYRPDRAVREVHLAGTFNDWNTSSHPLEDADGDGVYTADVELKAGPCRYKFLVDGAYWTHDPASRILTGIFHESFFVAGSPSQP
jgi:beta-lactamase regulating signal transducer with metallopeptidase domain/peroxiredoxin